MELTAAIRALEALTRPCRVELHTDSTYVRDGITRWVHKWRSNGWRTSDRKPVKNAELWQALIEAADAAPGRMALGQGATTAIPRTSGSTPSPAPRPTRSGA